MTTREDVVRVAVVGVGVIGRRVAGAVDAQPDMVLTGVLVRSPSPHVLLAESAGWPLYADGDSAIRLEAAGALISGSLDDLLAESDVVVDCAQRGLAVTRLDRYAAHGVAPVFCGGEDLAALRPTFSTFVTYDAAVAARRARVASCNATALARLLHPLQSLGLRQVYVNLIRCATDPDKAEKGAAASASVTCGRSRHSDELQALFPGLDTYSHATVVPMIHGHVLTCAADLEGDASSAPDVLAAAPRVELRDAPTDTRRLVEPVHPVAHGRATVLVWRDSVDVVGDRLYLQAHVHMEAITIPDTVDAVRAVWGRCRDAAASAAITDRALGMRSETDRCDGVPEDVPAAPSTILA